MFFMYYMHRTELIRICFFTEAALMKENARLVPNNKIGINNNDMPIVHAL